MRLAQWLLLVYFLLYDEVNYCQDAECQDEIFDVVAVEMYLGFKFRLWHYRVKIPSEGCENTVPCSGSNSGEKKKTPEIHACQACRDANKMTNAWNKATCNGGYLTVVIKVFLAFFYFFLIQQAHLSPFAVCKTIDDRTSEIFSCYVIDCCSDVSAKCGKQDYEPNVEISTCCMVGGRGDNKLRRHWYYSAFKHHKEEDCGVIEIVE